MKISLIHPSFGRPEKAKQTYRKWMDGRCGYYDIEHILSLDFSDKTTDEYEVFGYNSKIIQDHNNSVVEAANEAAKTSTGDALVYMSDDFSCPYHWDRLIVDKLKNITEPTVLKVDDCLQPFSKEILTIPIMNRLAYKKLGYFFHPAYKSMFSDNDLYMTCKGNGVAFIECPELKFPHEHHSVGKSENDDTYKRSEASFEEGRKIFNERKLLGFTL